MTWWHSWPPCRPVPKATTNNLNRGPGAQGDAPGHMRMRTRWQSDTLWPMDLPTLRQLEYVVAIADTLNFGRAAEACNVSQPGLSSQIKQVEELLGLSLFDRTPKGVIPTPAGQEIILRARQLLAHAQAMVEVAHSFQAPLTGTIRLGVIPTIAPYLLPRLMPTITEEFPTLRLLLLEGQTSDLVRKLHKGELDLLLLDLDVPLGPCKTLHLLDDAFCVLVPKTHEFAKMESVEEAQLNGRQFLLLDDGHCMRDRAMDICTRAEGNELGDFRAASLNTLLRMVENGVGITLIPEMALDVELRDSSSLVALRFGDPSPVRRVGLAWRETSPRGEEFALLGNVLAG